jgi:hypothetical protein
MTRSQSEKGRLSPSFCMKTERTVILERPPLFLWSWESESETAIKLASWLGLKRRSVVGSRHTNESLQQALPFADIASLATRNGFSKPFFFKLVLVARV